MNRVGQITYSYSDGFINVEILYIRKEVKEIKGIQWHLDNTLKCGTCKRQGQFRLCKKYKVKAPDKQQACVKYKIR